MLRCGKIDLVCRNGCGVVMVDVAIVIMVIDDG